MPPYPESGLTLPVTVCRPNRDLSGSPRTASGRQYGAMGELGGRAQVCGQHDAFVHSLSLFAVGFLTGIVSRIHIRRLQGPEPVDIDDGFTFGPFIVPHLLRYPHEGAGGQIFSLCRIELFAQPHYKGPLDHGDVSIHWMPMRRQSITIGHLESNGVQPASLRRVSVEHRELCSRRECGWPRLPRDLTRGEHRMTGIFL